MSRPSLPAFFSLTTTEVLAEVSGSALLARACVGRTASSNESKQNLDNVFNEDEMMGHNSVNKKMSMLHSLVML